MKNNQSKLLLLLVSLLISNFCNYTYAGILKMNLRDAISQKIISTDLSGNVIDGKIAIEGDFVSNSADELQIIIESGQTFAPNEDSHQPVLNVTREIFNIKPKSKLKKSFFGYCMAKLKGSPMKRKYVIGKLAQPKLVFLAKYIQDNQLDNGLAQHGVWCITDNLKMSDYKNKSQADDIDGLSNYLNNLDVLILNSQNTTIKQKINFHIDQPSKVSIVVIDEDGTIVSKEVKSVKFNSGQYDYFINLKLPSNKRYKAKIIYAVANQKTEELIPLE
jgi:hypothetical protein